VCEFSEITSRISICFTALTLERRPAAIARRAARNPVAYVLAEAINDGLRAGPRRRDRAAGWSSVGAGAPLPRHRASARCQEP